MCDGPGNDGCEHWCGWMPLPRVPYPAKASGDWIDLTHPLSPEVPRSGMFAAPKLTRIAEMPAKPLNVTHMDTVVHIGTHVDSPRHFCIDGPTMEAIPLEHLIGRGVVIRLDKPRFGTIEPVDLEGAEPGIEPGDIVAIDTGWSETWRTPAWGQHPYLSVEAAQWLVNKRVKLVALDTQTPDLPLERRPKDFTWPVHRALLRDGVLIAEQLANLRSLAGQCVEFMFGALNIVDSDGAPARVVARKIAR